MRAKREALIERLARVAYAAGQEVEGYVAVESWEDADIFDQQMARAMVRDILIDLADYIEEEFANERLHTGRHRWLNAHARSGMFAVATHLRGG